MKKVFILLILGLLFFGCIENEEEKVEMGDKVVVDYITYLEDGTVLDTSLEDIAKENEIYDLNREYSPIDITILDNNGYIKGFTYGLINLTNGSNETLIIYPEMAYGKMNESEIFEMPRYYSFPLIEELNKTEFEKEFELNETIKEQVWEVTVINITNTTYIFEHHPKINQTFINMGIPQIIYNIDKTQAFIEVDLEEGAKHYFEHPISHSLRTGVVSSVTNDTVTIDFNKKLAGIIIYMDVWVRDITKRQ